MSERWRSSAEAAFVEIFFIPSERVADFVEQSRADLVGKIGILVARKVADVIDPKRDAGNAVGIFVKKTKRVGFDAGLNIVGGRGVLDEDGYRGKPFPDRGWELCHRRRNNGLREFKKAIRIHGETLAVYESESKRYSLGARQAGKDEE